MGGLRRARGEGTFERLPSGLWRCVTKLGGRKLSGSAAPTKAEAQANLRARLQGLANESASGLDSWSKWARSWLTARRPSLSPTTVETYQKIIASVEGDLLDAIPMVSIREPDLRLWCARQRLAPKTLATRLAFIVQILRAGGNPARYAPPRKDRHARRPLTAEETALLLAHLPCLPVRDRVAVLLCLECGLRRSEACGLRHEDREAGGIRIRRAVLRVKGELRVRAHGKTAASSAWIPLPASLLEDVGHGKGYVLGSDKWPLYPDTLERIVKRALRGAGVTGVPYAGPHALRRTYGMRLLEAGVDVVTAAELMRHDAATLLPGGAQENRKKVLGRLLGVDARLCRCKPCLPRGFDSRGVAVDAVTPPPLLDSAALDRPHERPHGNRATGGGDED